MISLTRLTFQRARRERLPQIAGSLTFTTVLSIVPLVSVSFALLTRFPIFARFEQALDEYLLTSMLPPQLSHTVLANLHHFADNASGLTVLGSCFVLMTAIALMLTIENALNQIWGVRRARPLLKRIGLYALMLVAGPPLAGASLWATSYALVASIGLIGTLPPPVAFAFTLGPALLAVVGLAALFYFVPNTQVRRRDALAGALIGGIALEIGKRAFTAYVTKIPTYKAVYGALAALPVFMLWVYLSWLVTLTAALIAANLGQAGSRAGGSRSRARA
ncbi:MAG TPA: YihY family inner membrane protein [Burkholderiaceae bacterium]